MRAVRPDNKVMTQQKLGCTEVLSFSKHWPCLFPQHGPGRKHMRRIELADWQQVIVEGHPGDFARGPGRKPLRGSMRSSGPSIDVTDATFRSG